ncbi:MAG: dephospho-CoA kinase [Synergistaceae bacterium]|nr:dephospho-CoA kinase [Synergistaceae bacterium]
MFTVALTGEVGAGKSSVARVWKSLGAHVIDTDLIAKEQWQRPEIMMAARRRWGDDLIRDGIPDYSKIAERAFENGEEHDFTNRLIHPGAIESTARMMRGLRGWVTLEIPLLFESGWLDLIDCIICVTAPDDLKAARNSVRGWGNDEIRRREKFMIDMAKKQAMSDIVLCNSGSMESWETQARELGLLMRSMAWVYELTTYCSSEDNARHIASALVENRFAASVNISAAESCYRWRGEVCREQEWGLRCMTTERALRGAIACIRQNHTYELPCITSSEVCRSNFETLKWVVECCDDTYPLSEGSA